MSIQSLILVDYPFFNEPGFERSMGTPDGDTNSAAYNAYLRLGTVRFAMRDQLKKTPREFQDVIRKHFFLQRTSLKEQCNKWLADAEDYQPAKHGYVTSFTQSDYKSNLQSAVAEFFTELDKLKG